MDLVCLWIGRIFCVGGAVLILGVLVEWLIDRMARVLGLAALFTDFMWKHFRTANVKPLQPEKHGGGNKE